MAPPTNQELHAKCEKHCFAVTPERKYYKQHNGYMHVPMFNTERILNEVASLQFVAENTDITLPKLYACFEDDSAAYLVTEYVEGVGMNELDAEKRDIVAVELETYLEKLKALTSKKWGGPDGIVLPPYRIMRHSNRRPWRMKPRETQDLVFCHNDLSVDNVIVDPESLKIRAIVDWEYAGFYPPEFEAKFFLRPGPSVALEGEVDDTDILTSLIARDGCEG